MNRKHRKFLFSFLLFAFGVLILTISLIRMSLPRYSFKLAPTPPPYSSTAEISLDLPETGWIEPDKPWWFLQVFWDKAKIWMTKEPRSRTQIILSVANSRLIMGKRLVDKGEYDLGVSVFVKGEAYLLEASQYAKSGDPDLAIQIAKASLMHWQVLESSLHALPEDAKPFVVNTMNTSKIIYGEFSQQLLKQGIAPPQKDF